MEYEYEFAIDDTDEMLFAVVSVSVDIDYHAYLDTSSYGLTACFVALYRQDGTLWPVDEVLRSQVLDEFHKQHRIAFMEKYGNEKRY
jgi:hypothetical protein